MKEWIISLLFPRRCPVCGDIVLPWGEFICPGCEKRLSFIKEPTCKRCGKEISNPVAEYCFDCARRKRSFEYGKALLNYNQAARTSMAGIKYKNKREYLDYYIREMCARYGRQILRMKADALVPVPIHPSRRRSRGYNQAELLARGIGKSLGIPVQTDLLFRNKKTAPQKQLSPQERLLNLQEAFVAGTRPENVKSVILVDDIYTTGSTIEACARALRGAGVEKVYFLSICIGQGQ